MNVWVRTVASLTLLVGIVLNQTECAGQAVKKAARTKSAPTSEKAAPADAAPADAMKAANRDPKAAMAEAEAEEKKRVAEQAKLDFVANSVRALFGGVVDAPEAGIAVEVQADVDLQNDAMTQQFVAQLHPIMKSELGFVRLMCSDLTPEQRGIIRKSADDALRQAAKQQAKQQNQMQRGMAVRNNPVEASKVIRDAIHKSLTETLTEPQLARYTEEEKQRTEKRRRAAVLCLVSRLDGQLYLTADQREKITDSLTSKWQDSWEKWLTMMNMYGDRYFPMVPDYCVTPFLNTDQKMVWQNLQKIDFGSWWGGGGMIQNVDNDGWWGDEPANNDGVLEGVGIMKRIIGF